MFLHVILFLIGVCIPTAMPHLLRVEFLWALLVVSIFLLVTKKQFLKYMAIIILGFVWMSAYSHHDLKWSLPMQIENQPITVIGHIASIPEKNDLGINFEFYVQDFIVNSQKKSVHAKISLSWYKPYPVLNVGDQWQLPVKLKRPHGLASPGALDFDKVNFFKGIRAKGYVLNKQKPILLASHHHDDFINRIRQVLDEKIQQHLGNSPMSGLIRAVTVGDKSAISQAQWTVFQRTGTNHLMAIAGLHIGLVSGLFFMLVNFVWRCVPCLCLRLASIRAAAMAAIMSAVAYSALAGFEVPTQRAIVMLSLFMGSIIFKKRLRPWHAWSWALLIVLLINPLNVLSAGFWLSFIAVGSLIFGFSGRLSPKGLWWKWGRAQWVMGLALIPITLFVFQQASFISPLANALAIPCVGLVVVPLSLIACFFSFSWSISSVLFSMAAGAMQAFWFVLQWLSDLPLVAWQHAMPSVLILCLLCLGMLVLLSPRGFLWRPLGLIFMLPIIFYQAPHPKSSDFWLTLLDVGQGLSSVIQTSHHVLVFDTGADYGDGFDMGSVVVVPYLRSRGITHLDTLVVSHGDNDHIGGAHSLLKQYPASLIFTSVPDRFATMTPAHSVVQTCLAGQSWTWDGVSFSFLYPTPSLLGLDNNSSCVLKISNGIHSVLLTGDIEKPAEDYLVSHSDQLHADILVAPHHGSKTSSSPAFVHAVNPSIVLFPVGYLNKYHFPSASIVQEYSSLGVKMMDTSSGGAIFFDVGSMQSKAYRTGHKNYWS